MDIFELTNGKGPNDQWSRYKFTGAEFLKVRIDQAPNIVRSKLTKAELAKVRIVLNSLYRTW